ncbi:MAG: HK97 family phage prohead protease [Methanobrevibacter sp.]|nr:HK97 family phage prohead protease [Methanobrevibacter sp.]
MKLEKGQLNKKDVSIITEDLGDRSVQFTISKEVVDRDGDILRASGVDFTNYMKNPVFLSFHNSREFPLGKVTKFWVEGNSVKAIVYFPPIEELSSNPEQASEKAKLVDFTYHCYKTGMLNAVSVGFIPLEWVETEKGFDILKWELLEFSAVAVPANQDAIAEAVKSFGDDFAKGLISKPVEKAGKRVSAETREILNRIKACGDEIEKCQKSIKACSDNLRKALAELDDDEPEEEQTEDKTLNIITTVELPDVPRNFDN